MRLLGMVMAMAFLPMAALAEDNHWRDCAEDADCVAIHGTCGMTAVNVQSRNEASEFYKQEAIRANCAPAPFWKAAKQGMRCRLNQCEMYALSETRKK